MLITRSRIIDATPKKTWPYLVDIKKEIKWRKPQVLKLKYSKGNKCEPGSRVVGTTEILDNRDTYENEITAVEKNKRVAWEAVPGTSDVGSTGEYILEKVKGSTKMSISIDYVPQNAKGWLTLPLIRLLAPGMLDNFIRQLAELVE